MSPPPFSWLTALARASGTMSNKGGKNKCPRLISDLRDKIFNVLSLGVMLAVGFSCVSFIGLRKFPSFPTQFSNGWVLFPAHWCSKLNFRLLALYEGLMFNLPFGTDPDSCLHVRPITFELLGTQRLTGVPRKTLSLSIF